MFRPDEDGFRAGSATSSSTSSASATAGCETQDADQRARSTAPRDSSPSARAVSGRRPTATPTGRSARRARAWPSPAPDNSNFPDGNIVEKGAQAYRLRAPTDRAHVHQDVLGFAPAAAAVDFDSTNVSQACLGAADADGAGPLINWAAQGLDVDPCHRRRTKSTACDDPAERAAVGPRRRRALAPGRHQLWAPSLAPQVVVFYGGNDGVLRAVNGNRGEPSAQPIGSVAAGDEMWAFMAPEFFPHIKRLRKTSYRSITSATRSQTRTRPSPTDSTGR